jgi:hypothetical protein
MAKSQSPSSDVVDTYSPPNEKHYANILRKALKDPNQDVYSKGSK